MYMWQFNNSVVNKYYKWNRGTMKSLMLLDSNDIIIKQTYIPNKNACLWKLTIPLGYVNKTSEMCKFKIYAYLFSILVLYIKEEWGFKFFIRLSRVVY